MQTPLTLTFRHVESSPALEARIRQLIDRLERMYGRITRCSVVIDAPSGHHTKGAAFNVRIQLEVPGKEIIASNVSRERPDHHDVYVALRDAFEGAKRQLQQFARMATA